VQVDSGAAMLYGLLRKLKLLAAMLYGLLRRLKLLDRHDPYMTYL